MVHFCLEKSEHNGRMNNQLVEWGMTNSFKGSTVKQNKTNSKMNKEMVETKS